MRWFPSSAVLCAGLSLLGCRSTSSDVVASDMNGGAAAEAPNSRSAWSLVCNFDAVSTGVVPTGFTPASGDWSVVEDATAPSPMHALAQIGKSPENAFNLVVMDDVKETDIDLVVKMKAVAGEADQGGGLAWRIHDAKNYYMARFNPLEHNLRVYKVMDGERKQLQSAGAHLSAGWHELRVTMHGDTIRAYVDGRGYITVRDTSFPGSGKVGLWTKADAQTRFDDLKIGEVP